VQAGGSFDTIAGSIESMFTFSATTPDEQKAQAERKKLVLDPETGIYPGMLR
jgi:hypothetical protein